MLINLNLNFQLQNNMKIFYMILTKLSKFQLQTFPKIMLDYALLFWSFPLTSTYEEHCIPIQFSSFLICIDNN